MPSEQTLREARARYFADNGFGDGGYDDRWVKLKAGPLTLCFPNTAARVRAVRFHDLHHVLTGYATTWTGEAETVARRSERERASSTGVADPSSRAQERGGREARAGGATPRGAWEVASGCGRHLAAWALNLQAMAIGLVIAPGAVWRAFVRGRATRNLYGEPAHAPISDALLDARVDDLRARLGLAAPPPPPAALDRLTFAAWSGVALATLGLVALGPPLAVAAAVGWAVWLRPG